MNEIRKKVVVIFLSVLALMLSACAKVPTKDGAKTPPPPGSLSPGYALQRNLEKLTNLLGGATTAPAGNEAEMPAQEVPTVVGKEEIILVKEVPAGEDFSSSASSRVFIRPTMRKIKYAVVERKK